MRFVRWFEIPASDFKRAVSFYRSVFNVEFQFEELTGVAVAFFKLNGEEQVGGAIVEVDGKVGDSNGPVLFFDANIDMSGICNRIEKEGGKVLIPKTMIKNKTSEGKVVIAKTFIDNNTGYYAYFLDSEGNKMGLYSNS